MRFCWCSWPLLLTFFAVGPPGQTVLADDLLELARSVRWRHLALQAKPPDDLTVDVARNVSALRYAEWVYETPDSPRVAPAVAEAGDRDFVLYADGSRDHAIRQRDFVEGTGELRMLSLAAQQIVGRVVKEYPRQVLFRWRGGNADLSVATATRIEHTVHLDGDESGRALKTRQIDGDANGLFADTNDLLQIDLDHNGRFDPFLETFPFRPLMKVRGRRWFAKADRFGTRVQLQPATASGRVRVRAYARSSRDRTTDLILTLSGEDGSVYSLTGASATTELPAGRYAASVLFVAIRPEGTDRGWQFTFSRDGDIRAGDWLQVREGSTVEFDPIGELVLDAVVERAERKEMRSLNVQPRLSTGSGLRINLCRIEGMNSSPEPQCHVSLVGVGDQSLDQSSSGFG